MIFQVAFTANQFSYMRNIRRIFCPGFLGPPDCCADLGAMPESFTADVWFDKGKAVVTVVVLTGVSSMPTRQAVGRVGLLYYKLPGGKELSNNVACSQQTSTKSIEC